MSVKALILTLGFHPLPSAAKWSPEKLACQKTHCILKHPCPKPLSVITFHVVVMTVSQSQELTFLCYSLICLKQWHPRSWVGPCRSLSKFQSKSPILAEFQFAKCGLNGCWKAATRTAHGLTVRTWLQTTTLWDVFETLWRPSEDCQCCQCCEDLANED